MSSPDLFSLYDQQTTEAESAAIPGKPETRGRKPLSDAYDVEILRAISRKKLKKQYYGIGEVAEMFHVNTSLIRYWENEFSILKPRKNRKGDRLFRPEDIRNLQLIYYLLRECKYTIEGAKQKLKANKGITEQNFEMVQSLQKVKQFLVEMKERL